MSRPLMLLRITELEALFEESRRDKSALRKLEAELEHRQVPRARSLLDSVRTAMTTTDLEADVPRPVVANRSSAIPIQPDLGPLNPVRLELSEIQHSAPIGAEKIGQSREEQPLIPIAEAYRLLKANPGSDWESVELARRRLVQKASPAGTPTGKRRDLQEEANRINAAYKAIVSTRMKR